MAQTFGAWLKRQADRDDPIGDLAQDFIRDINRTQHGWPSRWSALALKQRLMYLGVERPVWNAYRSAVAEWKEAGKVEP